MHLAPRKCLKIVMTVLLLGTGNLLPFVNRNSTTEWKFLTCDWLVSQSSYLRFYWSFSFCFGSGQCWLGFCGVKEVRFVLWTGGRSQSRSQQTRFEMAHVEQKGHPSAHREKTLGYTFPVLIKGLWGWTFLEIKDLSWVSLLTHLSSRFHILSSGFLCCLNTRSGWGKESIQTIG